MRPVPGGTMTSVEGDAGAVELLVVSAGSRRCALRLHDVEEIVRAVAVTPLVGAPAITAGVIDVRGRIVAVLDLRRRLGEPASVVRPDDHFVLVRAGPRTVALRADGGARLVQVPADGVRHAAGVDVPEYVAGFVTLPDGLVVVTDVAAFLSAVEGDALDDALRAADLEPAVAG